MRLLEQEQGLPLTREEVWAFFSDARNLEAIAPADLHVGSMARSGGEDLLAGGGIGRHTTAMKRGLRKLDGAVVAAAAMMAGTVGAEDHEVRLQGIGCLTVWDGGKATWAMDGGGIHDIHVPPNGHDMVQKNMREVVEIDPRGKKAAWRLDEFECYGNWVPDSLLPDVLGRSRR